MYKAAKLGFLFAAYLTAFSSASYFEASFLGADCNQTSNGAVRAVAANGDKANSICATPVAACTTVVIKDNPVSSTSECLDNDVTMLGIGNERGEYLKFRYYMNSTGCVNGTASNKSNMKDTVEVAWRTGSCVPVERQATAEFNLTTEFLSFSYVPCFYTDTRIGS